MLTAEEARAALDEQSRLQRELAGAGGPAAAPAGGEGEIDTDQLAREKLDQIRQDTAAGTIEREIPTPGEAEATARAVEAYTAELSNQLATQPLTDNQSYAINRLGINPADVIAPAGRAPRGQGAEYATRRKVAARIRRAQRSIQGAQNELDRPQSRGRNVYRSQLNTRKNILNAGVNASLQTAFSGADWSLKSELISGIMDQVTAQANAAINR